MITVEKEKLFPRFLFADDTGNALAEAITQGLKIFCQVIDDGIGQMTDPEKMPEKRMDELAWEYGIYYDYSADLATKRELIRNAYMDYAAYGTLWAVKKYGSVYLDDVQVVESDSGLDHRFWVLTTDTSDVNKMKKAIAAIEATKNVRSVFQGIRQIVSGSIRIAESSETE